jgi:hypothetical protein
MDLHIELCFLWALRVCPSSALSVLSEALKTIQSLPLGLISLVKIEELLNLSFFCLFPPKVYPWIVSGSEDETGSYSVVVPSKSFLSILSSLSLSFLVSCSSCLLSVLISGISDYLPIEFDETSGPNAISIPVSISPPTLLFLTSYSYWSVTELSSPPVVLTSSTWIVGATWL